MNIPGYSIQLERTELQEIKAAESTGKQRLGELGGTQPGECDALYNYASGEQRKHPLPEMCQSELVNTHSILLKSRLRTDLQEFRYYVGNKPSQAFIGDEVKELERFEKVVFLMSSGKRSDRISPDFDYL
ncbi:unnamed protein product [Rotaria sp. Silwood1]|nr:unnamed protein product [Rotaria sp. Silwood1]CAF1656186.1 unnamed protein product [Rotaria sp. Silwood1]CAF3870129.1 unnamed protein product [Rotaria sp. Silwood1]